MNLGYIVHIYMHFQFMDHGIFFSLPLFPLSCEGLLILFHGLRWIWLASPTIAHIIAE